MYGLGWQPICLDGSKERCNVQLIPGLKRLLRYQRGGNDRQRQGSRDHCMLRNSIRNGRLYLYHSLIQLVRDSRGHERSQRDLTDGGIIAALVPEGRKLCSSLKLGRQKEGGSDVY